jgi:PAS domain S-box-containing protein
VTGIFIEGMDTTEHKLAEMALRESEERYRTLFESIDEGFCVIEVLFDAGGRACDYRFLEMNPAFAGQTGFGDVLGRRMRELVPDHEQLWFDIYGKVAATGESVRFENRAEAMGRWYDVNAFRVGKPEERRVAILFNDITARKRSEEALRDADRRKDEFIATLAHELRNPLAPIRNAIQFMGMKGLQDPALEHAREIMERQLQHLVRLVDDLLEMSRITRGLIALQKEQVSLERVVKDALESVEPIIAAAGHELKVELPGESIHFDADPTRISQVLLNLLNNAARYTPRGGHITLAARATPLEVEIRIRDDGIGIPRDKLEIIFQPFSQADPANQRTAGGLGIGLSLARRLARLHGGDIEARSEGEGRGSEFILRLPVTEAKAVAQPGLGAQSFEQAGDRSPSRTRILVVDDNADAADTLAANLALDGYATQTVYGGAAALEAMRTFAPDIVLLDIGMPEIDGYEVARRIRAMPRGERVRLVALTGWGQEDDKRRAAEMGFDEHLTKPVDPAVLMSVIGAGTGPTPQHEQH